MYTLPLQYPMVNYTHAESPIMTSIFRAGCNSIGTFSWNNTHTKNRR